MTGGHELAGRVKAGRVHGGLNSRNAWTPHGTVIVARSPRRDSHPWSVTVVWDPVAKGWSAGLEAGLVNCVPPVMQMTKSTAPAATLQRLRTTRAKATAGDTVWARLYEGATVGMQWRAVGWDSVDGSTAPQFFLDRGAANKAGASGTDPQSTAQAVVDSLTAATPKGLRLLRACDLVLHQPRNGLAANVYVSTAIATGYFLQQDLTYKPPAPGDRLKVYATTKFNQELVASQQQIDPASGQYEQATWDEILVATVWALSPPDAAPYSDPDETWKIYVRHNLFWNLDYVTNVPEGVAATPTLSLVIPTPVGLSLQPLVDSILGVANDAISQAYAMLVARNVGGAFFVAGAGSGADVSTTKYYTALAKSAVANTSRQTVGLDKVSRLKQAARAAKQVPQSLDPEWPYTVPHFPVEFMT